MANSILEVRNLSVKYDSEAVLSGVSFSVQPGEALAVIGPNGAGKTVLFKALLNLVRFQGSVAWQSGVTIGYVPQKLAVDAGTPLTVEEFFLLKSQDFWRPKKEFLAHLSHELNLVGLQQEVIRRSVRDLSGGQLQRLLIAWAMLNHPQVLLLDEPTAGVDVGFEESVYQMLHRLQEERGTTVLLISHDLNVVYRYAQQVIFLNKKVICQGKPSEVLNSQALTKLYGERGFYEHAHTH